MLWNLAKHAECETMNVKQKESPAVKETYSNKFNEIMIRNGKKDKIKRESHDWANNKIKLQ